MRGLAAARATGRLRGLIFALVWLSCAWFGSWEFNPNNATRLFAALSIVEQGDATIDEYAELTIDKAKFGDHYYLDKAPGMTLMALPAVALADARTGTRASDVTISMWNPASVDFLKTRLRLATATSVALLTAIAAMLLFDMGRRLGGSEAAGVVTALGYGLGTPAWGWSTSLFGHAATADLLVIATWAVWRGTDPARARPSVSSAALAGPALGWGIVVEYPAVIEGAVIGLWALWRLRRWSWVNNRVPVGAAVAAGIVALLPLFAYNLFAFNTLFRLGYQGVVGFDGMNQGLFGLTYPKLGVLWQILWGGPRGLVWVAPVVLPGAAGLVLLARQGQTRDLGIMALATVAIVLLYNASYAYWDGGNSTGPRHAVPALGFLAIGLAPLWRAARALWAKVGLLAILTLSIAINAAIASAEIATGGQGSFPLWSDVIVGRFWGGQLRTIPNEWWGWSAWGGFGLWALLAGGMLALILTTLWQGRTSTKAG